MATVKKGRVVYDLRDAPGYRDMMGMVLFGTIMIILNLAAFWSFSKDKPVVTSYFGTGVADGFKAANTFLT